MKITTYLYKSAILTNTLKNDSFFNIFFLFYIKSLDLKNQPRIKDKKKHFFDSQISFADSLSCLKTGKVKKLVQN